MKISLRTMKAMTVFLVLFIFCCSCTGNNETLPGISVPISQMNQDIQLVPEPGGWDHLQNNYTFGIQIKNLSAQQVIFPGDYGVKLYIKQGEEWKRVENSMSYPEGETVLPLAKTWPPGDAVAFIPLIPNLNEKITLRVVIIGHLENDPNRTVGAYIDAILNP